MKLSALVTILACLCLASQAWGGFVMAGSANPTWISSSASVVLTQFSCVHRLTLHNAFFQGGGARGSGASRAGLGGTGSAGSMGSSGAGGGLTSSSKQNVTAELTSIPTLIPTFTPGVDDQIDRSLQPPLPAGIDDQITRAFTPGIDDRVNWPIDVSVPTTPADWTQAEGTQAEEAPDEAEQVEGAPSNLSPLTAAPTTEQIVNELAGDPAVTTIGPSQYPPTAGAGIANTHAVPEPGSFALLAFGLLALTSGRFRKQRQ